MKKKLKITFNAPVVLTFVMICFIATLLGVLTGGRITQSFFMTYHSSLKNPMTYLRFFTHVFGHDGWSHFIGNASYLLLLGPMLEEKHGSRELVEIIGVTALITGVVNYIFFWNVGLCGASGVVFAFIILASFTSFKEGEIPLTFILVTVVFIGQQIYEAVAVANNVSNISHIIGGMIGALLGYNLNQKSKYRY
ncbi:MAG: rhomboid family intramembrane serine protease [Blautia sp.]|uniref:rhomboid family intramembrane serine protease n=1 Tax=Blautia sp. TaxID=1955243 RepID=UPI002A7EFA0A|nr:rhomboid family intramembrane serine protease [Blautia sp.]MCI5963055.1 rhomboid family intramembrane serine protease [Clostridia bacterium]MDY4054037.1 rhomboid family intramembrane serine protease [Blautia sp.]